MNRIEKVLKSTENVSGAVDNGIPKKISAAAEKSEGAPSCSPANKEKLEQHVPSFCEGTMSANNSLTLPPKPPRSAFMCFADAKEKEIIAQRGVNKKRTDILKIVAEEWKALSMKDRATWDEEARNDKVRYVQEKSLYKGPHMIPRRRAKKHPLAPRRPASAFLKYSQAWRQRLRSDHPKLANTDLSRLLGEMWRNASPEEKRPYREQEEKERAVYKENIKRFRDSLARKDAASRSSHRSVQAYHEGSPDNPTYNLGQRGAENWAIDPFNARASMTYQYHVPNLSFRSVYDAHDEYPPRLERDSPSMQEGHELSQNFSGRRSDLGKDLQMDFCDFTRYP